MIRTLREELEVFLEKEVYESLNWNEAESIFDAWLKLESDTLLRLFPSILNLAVGGDGVSTIPLSAFWLCVQINGRLVDDHIDGHLEKNPLSVVLAVTTLTPYLATHLPDSNPVAYSRWMKRLLFIGATSAQAIQIACAEKSNQYSVKMRLDAFVTTNVQFCEAVSVTAAEMATDDNSVIECAKCIGRNLGMLDAIRDDVEDVLEDLLSGRNNLLLSKAYELGQHGEVDRHDYERYESVIESIFATNDDSKGAYLRLLNALLDIGVYGWVLLVFDSYHEELQIKIEELPGNIELLKRMMEYAPTIPRPGY